jgi:hypothetical protein
VIRLLYLLSFLLIGAAESSTQTGAPCHSDG